MSDILESLTDLIERYKLQLDEKDNKILALTEENLDLRKIAIIAKELATLPPLTDKPTGVY